MVVRFGLQLKSGCEFRTENLIAFGNCQSRRPAAEQIIMFCAEHRLVCYSAFPSSSESHRISRTEQPHGCFAVRSPLAERRLKYSASEFASSLGKHDHNARGCCRSRHCFCKNAHSCQQSFRKVLGFEFWRTGAISDRQTLKCGFCTHKLKIVSGPSSFPSFPSVRGADHKNSQLLSAGNKTIHTISRKEGRYICVSAEEKVVQDKFLGTSVVREHVREDESPSTNSESLEGSEASSTEIVVVNFYHFVHLDDPHLEVARHSSFIKGKDIRGRIYISEQGINAQLSGPTKQALEYADWVKQDSRFSDMLVQSSPSQIGHAFPRLRLRYKPSLVQVEGGTEHLPITDPSARAVKLTPREWSERLDGVSVLGGMDATALQLPEIRKQREGLNAKAIASNSRRPVVLLDVRNGYEWDVGHFNGAQRPDVDSFKTTGFGLAEDEPAENDPLANVDKEAVDVMMYCTGGIRCDVFSTILRKKGFNNLYTLKGGVSNFLKEEGPKQWAGNLFVFDSRLAVSPIAFRANGSHDGVEDSQADTNRRLTVTSTFARCRLCGDPISEPRHRNCANLDCNLLYISCEDCVLQQRGCCSESCSAAPKLRPLLTSHQYDRWHNYRPVEPKPPKPADYVSRRALKRRRRKERRKQRLEQTASEQLERAG